jgi:hypothetical protein
LKFFKFSFLAFLFFSNIVGGQSHILLNYTNKNGLPSSNVYAIKQDKRGFIWATTDKGVVKYDGKNFKLFTVDHGLASNDNFAMLIDSKDNIWLYSFKAISKIEPNNICKVFGNTKNYYSQFLINSKDEIYFSVLDSMANKIKFGKYSNYIIKDDRIIRLNSKEQEKERLIKSSFDFKYFTGYCYFINNVLLNFVYDLNPVQNQLIDPFVIYGDLNNNTKILSLKIPILAKTSFTPYLQYLDNDHAIAFNEVAYRVYKNGNLNTTKFYPHKMKKISNREILRYGSILYIEFNKGIYTYNIETDEWQPFLILPKVTSILIDHEKNVWVSTMGEGIIKYSNLDINSGLLKIDMVTSEPIKKVNGYKNNSLWIANSKNEVKELLLGKKIFKPDLIDLRFLAADNYNNVFYGGSNDVYKNSQAFSRFGFKAMDLYQDSIAITSSFGTNFLNIKNLYSLKQFDNQQRTDISGRMYAVLLLSGKFYSGNQDGLFWGRPYLNELHPVCLDADNESIGVNGIKQTHNGFIWVATEGNGVYLLKDDVVIRHFNSELLDANIHSMKTDEKDRVWLATRKGVNLIQKVGDDFKIYAYNSFHGLPEDYINDIYCYDDILYVATDEGLARLKINQLNKTNFKIPPPVHINSFRIFKTTWKKVNHDTLYTFEHDENTVNFEYSGISYKSNGKVRFEYRLLPTQSEWLQTNNDNITFNNLEPNNYTFEVRAIDAIGNVSTKPAQTKFVIKKHFTDQLWFFFLIWLLALFIVLFIVLRYLKFRRLQAEESSRVEKLISELRLKSLQAQLNPHFIFNSLNAIQQFINTENKKSANDYLSRFARLMRLYLSGSDTQFISLAQELEVLKLYCSLEHLRFADKFQYSIQIDEKLPLDEYKVPAMLLQPHVENAIRHGLIPSDKDNNLLSIVVKATDNGIVCIIQDNGIGRARSLELKKHRSSNHRSMGNKISKERLEMIRSLNLANISEDITDIINSKGEICGTNVEIKITKNS